MIIGLRLCRCNSWPDAPVLKEKADVHQVFKCVCLRHQPRGNELRDHMRAHAVECKVYAPLPKEVCVLALASHGGSVPQELEHFKHGRVNLSGSHAFDPWKICEICTRVSWGSEFARKRKPQVAAACAPGPAAAAAPAAPAARSLPPYSPASAARSRPVPFFASCCRAMADEINLTRDELLEALQAAKARAKEAEARAEAAEQALKEVRMQHLRQALRPALARALHETRLYHRTLLTGRCSASAGW